MWVTGCQKGRQESNISLWDVMLEKAAWDIIERSHHQWAHTVPHWQIPITIYQDWSAQAKILWPCLQKGRWPLWKKKIIIQGTFKGIRRNRRPKVRWSDTLKKITGHSLNTLPYWRWQMLVVWSHIMGHNGSAVTWKWRRRLNLGVEQTWHPAFCLPIHRTDRTKIPWLW